MTKQFVWVSFFVLLSAFLSSCERNTPIPSNAKNASQGDKTVVKPLETISIENPVQLQFQKNWIEFMKNQEMAQNDIRKSEIFKEAMSFAKNYFSRNKIEQWQGKISSIGLLGNEASLTIESSLDGITFYYTQTILLEGIKEGTKVFKQLRDLKEGDNVFFSGKIYSLSSYETAKEYLAHRRLDTTTGVFFVDVSPKH